MELPQLVLELYGGLGGGEISGAYMGRVLRGAWADGWGWRDHGLLCRMRDATSKEEALALVALACDSSH